jgi:ring-1,2-phenylacetyl-CoA epoxidase subunit PaaD
MVARAIPSRDELFDILDEVKDPEVPVISVVELGIVRDAEASEAGVTVTITPTYSGCPAMREIEDEIRAALEDRGLGPVRIQTTYTPAWTTDWITAAAREKLAAGPGARRDRARHAPSCGVSAVPLLQIDEHRAEERVRIHGVQGDLVLPRVPAAVRGIQGDLI